MSDQDYDDSLDLTRLPSAPRLLSDTSQLSGAEGSSINSFHGGSQPDLSITELSLDPAPRKPKFSILPPKQHLASQDISFEDETIQEDSYANDTILQHDHAAPEDAIDNEAQARDAIQSREEALQQELQNIRRVNTTLHNYHDVLKATLAGRERFARTAAETNALLDRYVEMMSRTQRIGSLVMDPQWRGADDDVATITREQEEAERARLEAEERVRVEEEERRRREEELRRQAEEAAVRAEAEQKAQARAAARGGSRGTIRGVRGTRASMRGIRGSTVASRGTGRGSPTASGPSGSGATSRSTSSLGRNR